MTAPKALIDLIKRRTTAAETQEDIDSLRNTIDVLYAAMRMDDTQYLELTAFINAKATSLGLN
jgi:hypothetical protein